LNLLLLEEGDLDPGDPGLARLHGRRARHVVEILRAGPGDRVAVGLLRGRAGQGQVVEVTPDRVSLRLQLTDEPPPRSPVSIVLALPRPKILRKVLQAAASMGIPRIALVGSYRVEKSYFQSPVLDPAALLAELRLGLEQGRDTLPPVVTVHRHWKPFVEDLLDGLFPPGGPERLVAHPAAREPLGAAPPRRTAAVVAIGPEGGFTPYEESTLADRGFRPVTLGPRPLRVDVAVPFAVAQAEAWLRRGAAGPVG
jgi:16S rRNA (uracil1498-N3)-methyltransferase